MTRVCLSVRAVVGTVAVVGGILWAASAAAADRYALLIGVSDYPSFPGVSTPSRLDGPANDVDALQTVLTQKWGFPSAGIRTLKNREATRTAILAALDDLAKRAKAGDSVFIYYSGHGVSGLDAKSAHLSLHESTGALVPFDAVTPARTRISSSGLIVGRTDIRPRLDALDSKGAKVFVAFDACYSGQAVRSVRPGSGPLRLPARYVGIPAQEDDDKVKANLYAAAGKAPGTEPYPYRNVVYMAAAAQGETARDIDQASLPIMPTLDEKPHGAFSDALLRVLTNRVGADSDGNGLLSYREVQVAVMDIMADRGYGHSPQLFPPVAEDVRGMTNSPLFASGRPATGEAVKKAQAVPSKLRIATVDLNPAVMTTLARVPDVQLVTNREPFDMLVAEPQRGQLALRTVSDDTIASVAMQDSQKLVKILSGYVLAHKLRKLGVEGQRGALPFEINPSHFGGNFVFGQKLNFVVRPDRPSTLVILNVDADGNWSTLYPYDAREHPALAANQAHFVPGQSPSQLVQVQAPEGQDTLVAFSFDEPPSGLTEITGLKDVDSSDARLQRFVSVVQRMTGKFAFAKTELRVLPPRP